jgi:hypothetical protein
VAVLHVDLLQDGAQQFQVVMGGVLEFLDHSRIRGSASPSRPKFRPKSAIMPYKYQ